MPSRSNRHLRYSSAHEVSWYTHQILQYLGDKLSPAQRLQIYPAVRQQISSKVICHLLRFALKDAKIKTFDTAKEWFCEPYMQGKQLYTLDLDRCAAGVLAIDKNRVDFKKIRVIQVIKTIAELVQVLAVDKAELAQLQGGFKHIHLNVLHSLLPLSREWYEECCKVFCCKTNPSLVLPQVVLDILLVGNGCDGTFDEPLGVPRPEVLAPFRRAYRDPKHVFVLNLNVTALYEYLPEYEESSSSASFSNVFADVYGNVFTSITPPAQTRSHKHVLNAKTKLEAFIDAATKRAASVVVDISFLGVGFRRNGEGLRTIFSECFSKCALRNVRFYSNERMDARQKQKCRYFLGVTNASLLSSMRPQFEYLFDIGDYLRSFARWEIPKELRPIDRMTRLRRTIRSYEVDEPPDWPIPQMLIQVDLVLGREKKRKRGY